MPLTQHEKDKIYEEEKVRIEARSELTKSTNKRKSKLVSFIFFIGAMATFALPSFFAGVYLFHGSGLEVPAIITIDVGLSLLAVWVGNRI